MKSMNRALDPFGISDSFRKIHEAWMLDGAGLSGTLAKLNSDIQSLSVDHLADLLEKSGSKESVDDLESAFLEVVRNYSRLLQRLHTAYGNWIKDYISKAQGLTEKERQRSAFWANQVVNALSPSNCFWTNPSVVEKFLRSRGQSVLQGIENWLEDLLRGDNLVQLADTSVFKVGENLATTPGSVVFRNNLMELIQYSPTTERTYSVPLVFIQPWSNKFYIFDLTRQKSFVSYMVDQGFTVFITSWKNPTHDMRGVTYEDYMLQGARKAVDVAREICGVEQVHAAGYCIGGTLLATLMACLSGQPGGGRVPIKDITLFATLVDYSSPGDIDVFISEDVVDIIEGVIKRDGYLDKKYMAIALRLLRPNSLIWRYFVHNYLQGELPPKSEFLYWNMDSTRLPAAMCSYYLRELYMNNSLTKEDEITLGHQPIDLRRIEQPLYAVGAEQDHICPWTETFKICNLVSGPVRYTLSDEGHITGIVNPPSGRQRRRYRSGQANTQTTAEEWYENQRTQKGSWWGDWVQWLAAQSDSLRDPPPIGSAMYPPIEKAPGTYVMEK